MLQYIVWRTNSGTNVMDGEKRYRIYLCGGPNCTAGGRDALLKKLEEELWAWQLEDEVEVRVSGCQDRCDFAPNITIWPGPFHYSNLDPDGLARIVEQHLLKGEPVREFLHRPSVRR
jgi:NADP-reducing hydrogenase subunit HndC